YFNDGLYTNVLNCTVEHYGILKIGIKKSVSNSNDWTIFDNFTLSYLGPQEEDEPEEPNGINTISHTLKPTQGIYTLQGNKISSIIYPGIYVINGKKTKIK
ncbi:MAG: hypothetical protein KBT29_09515, partial [Prevotellaceae bacterium]|nr:hypothetical protein [Candidatus Minthosoma caballi]